MRDTVYQPYPGGPPPADQRPPAPASVRYAVWLMYAGAAASLLKVTADLVTWGTVRTAMRLALKNGARHVTPAPTASQLNAGITTTLAVVVVTGLIAAGLWIFLARATRSGSGRAPRRSSGPLGLAHALPATWSIGSAGIGCRARLQQLRQPPRRCRNSRRGGRRH